MKSSAQDPAFKFLRSKSDQEDLLEMVSRGQSCCSQHNRDLLNFKQVVLMLGPICVCVQATHLVGCSKSYNLQYIFYYPTRSAGKWVQCSEMQIQHIFSIPAQRGINSRTHKDVISQLTKTSIYQRMRIILSLSEMMSPICKLKH